MKVIMILLLFFTIIVGLKSGEVIKVPDGNNIIFGSSTMGDEKKSVSVFCIFNEDEIAGCLKVRDVLWIKYLPDEKKM